jgi:hypothetical protein
MGKTVTIRPPDMNQPCFIAGDWHSFDLDVNTYSILKQHASTLKEDEPWLIINGDFLDVPYFMAKSEAFKKFNRLKEGIEDFFLPKMEAELEWGNQILDELQKIFRIVIFISGNHDHRVEWYAHNHCPIAYRHNFNIDTGLRLEQRGISYIRYNDWLDWGSLSITHGQFHSATANKRHYEAAGGRNVIYSHVHKASLTPFLARGKTKMVWSLPAMSYLSPEYIKNRDTNWSTGYGQIMMRPDGVFNHYIFNIWDKKLVLPSGEVLDGKHPSNYQP